MRKKNFVRCKLFIFVTKLYHFILFILFITIFNYITFFRYNSIIKMFSNTCKSCYYIAIYFLHVE